MVGAKPGTGVRKIHNRHSPDVPGAMPAVVDGARIGQARLPGEGPSRHLRSERPADGPSSDLSSKTVKVLNAFRFKPSSETQTLGREASAGQDEPSKRIRPAEKTDRSSGSSLWGHDSRTGGNGKDSEEKFSVPTFALDHDQRDRSKTVHDESPTSDKRDHSSPSPFDWDDLDQEFVDYAFEATEPGLPSSIDALQEALTAAPVPLQQSSVEESEFGSDPFEAVDFEPPTVHACSEDERYASRNGSLQSLETATRLSQDQTQSMLPPSSQPISQTPTEPLPTETVKPLRLSPQTAISPAATQPPPPPPFSLTPFLRTRFPSPVPDASPIPSLTSTPRILTCFRTAEYLRVISCPSKTVPAGLLIELYALVTCSIRTGHDGIQQFVFADLFFPQRPPRLLGSWTGWEGSELFEEDGRRFLGATEQEGRLCRATVRPIAQGDGVKGEWGGVGVGLSPLANEGAEERLHSTSLDGVMAEVEVLNIWEASWDDVEYVKGIVCA